MAWVRARLCELQKKVHSTRRANDKVYQLLAHGRWFSPDTPASSTTKTDRHDIPEILLKVALNTKNQINQIYVTNVHGYVLVVVITIPPCPFYMTYYWGCIKSNTIGATSGAGIAYCSATPEFIPGV